MANPRTDLAHYGNRPVAEMPPFFRAYLIGRAARLLLAAWWIFAPAALGYVGTFPGRQSIVLGGVLVPILAVGLFVPEMRWALFAGGLWMIGSALISAEYFDLDRAWLHDVLTGGLALVLGATPMWIIADKPLAVPRRRKRTRGIVLRGAVTERVQVSPDDSRAEPPPPIVRPEDATLGREILPPPPP